MGFKHFIIGLFIFAISGCIGSDTGTPVDGGDGGGGEGGPPVNVSVTLAGKGAGSVKSAPAGIDCGTSCTAAFSSGSSVQLTATPQVGSVFTGWSGDACSGTDPVCTINPSADTAVTATFDVQQITLTVVPTGNGSVVSNPPGITCGAGCTAKFDYGTYVTLIAKPTPNASIFGGWSQGCSGTSSTCSLKLTADVTAGATFKTLATWDGSWSVPGATFSNGNLSVTNPSTSTVNVRSTIGVTTGKYYWEISVISGTPSQDDGGVGILESAMPNNAGFIGQVASGLAFGYGSCCTSYYMSWAGATIASGNPPASSAITAGKIYMFALDMTAGKFWAGDNGVWYNGGDPGTALNPAATGLSGTVYPGVTLYDSSRGSNALTANFGGSGFSYAVPSGFQPGVY